MNRPDDGCQEFGGRLLKQPMVTPESGVIRFTRAGAATTRVVSRPKPDSSLVFVLVM
jgi:hypothetical protein